MIADGEKELLQAVYWRLHLPGGAEVPDGLSRIVGNDLFCEV